MNHIFEAWLRTQHREAQLLQSDSDVLTVTPLRRAHLPERAIPQNSSSTGNDPTAQVLPSVSDFVTPYFMATFRCNGYILPTPAARAPEMAKDALFTVGIHFPDDYLHVADFVRVLTLLTPRNFYHANARYPHLCVGHLAPGTGIVDILYQVYDIITMRKATIREDDSLNPQACQWFRRHWDGKPIDTRPLRRRQLAINVASRNY